MNSTTAYMLRSNVDGLWMSKKRHPAGIATTGEYRFIELVRPKYEEAYSIEQRFGILQWMVSTANRTNPTREETGRWGACNAMNLLQRNPTCVSAQAPLTIGSLDVLKEAFQYALLSDMAGASARRWRREQDIDVTRKKMIHFRHWKPFRGAPLCGKHRSEQDIREIMRSMFELGGKMAVSMNSSHRRALEFYGMNVLVGDVEPRYSKKRGNYRSPKFTFTYSYGYEGSSWTETISKTEGEETFIETLERAVKTVYALGLNPGTKHNHPLYQYHPGNEYCKARVLELAYEEATQFSSDGVPHWDKQARYLRRRAETLFGANAHSGKPGEERIPCDPQPDPEFLKRGVAGAVAQWPKQNGIRWFMNDGLSELVPCPYGRPGETVTVKGRKVRIKTIKVEPTPAGIWEWVIATEPHRKN